MMLIAATMSCSSNVRQMIHAEAAVARTMQPLMTTALQCSATVVAPKQPQRACSALESAPEQRDDKDQQQQQNQAVWCRGHAHARCALSQSSGNARVERDGRGGCGCCARGGGGRQMRFELCGVEQRQTKSLHSIQSLAGQHVVGDVLSPAVALTPNGNCSKHRARAVSHERDRVQLHAQPF
jgi:hypothetical protein